MVRLLLAVVIVQQVAQCTQTTWCTLLTSAHLPCIPYLDSMALTFNLSTVQVFNVLHLWGNIFHQVWRSYTHSFNRYSAFCVWGFCVCADELNFLPLHLNMVQQVMHDTRKVCIEFERFLQLTATYSLDCQTDTGKLTSWPWPINGLSFLHTAIGTNH